VFQQLLHLHATHAASCFLFSHFVVAAYHIGTISQAIKISISQANRLSLPSTFIIPIKEAN